MNNRLKINLEYTGKVNPQPGDKPIIFQGQKLTPYLPSTELLESVKLAIALRRPLLIMGEPGCGKTKLALAITYEFTQNNQEYLKAKGLTEWSYETWYVKSTSKAKDGLYTYDALGRLRDAQLAGLGQLSDKELKALKDPKQEEYINFGALGNAFQSDIPTVVLIDEIDKADIDFPNDLLLELDEKRFFIEETKTEIPASGQEVAEPIILITSNNERNLPEAFLRRCFFHYIESPTKDELIAIVKAHFAGDLPKLITKQQAKQEERENVIDTKIDEIIDNFIELRNSLNQGGGKQISTSELLDWLRALFLSPETIEQQLKQGTPYLETLLKTRDEKIRYRQREKRKSTKQVKDLES